MYHKKTGKKPKLMILLWLFKKFLPVLRCASRAPPPLYRQKYIQLRAVYFHMYFAFFHMYSAFFL